MSSLGQLGGSVARVLPSPLGPLLAVARGDALVRLALPPFEAPGDAAQPAPSHPVLERLAAELEAYFAGRSAAFTVACAAPGTPFQRRVWSALGSVAPGTTLSYGALARRLGDAKLVRAVGGANARNPIAVVIPCHRVVGGDGALTGYAGGLEAKRRLLAHERRHFFALAPHDAVVSREA